MTIMFLIGFFFCFIVSDGPSRHDSPHHCASHVLLPLFLFLLVV